MLARTQLFSCSDARTPRGRRWQSEGGPQLGSTSEKRRSDHAHRPDRLISWDSLSSIASFLAGTRLRCLLGNARACTAAWGLHLSGSSRAQHSNTWEGKRGRPNFSSSVHITSLLVLLVSKIVLVEPLKCFSALLCWPLQNGAMVCVAAALVQCIG
jgi:hypothetical protein